MTRHIVMLLTVLGLLGSAHGQTDTGKLISEAMEAADNALVQVEITYIGDTGQKTATGMGVCYDADKGEFFTLAGGRSALRKDRVRSVKLIMPGPDRKSFVGEFMGMRPADGIVFVRAIPGQHNFKALRLTGKSNLTTGTQVVSVGLMPGGRASTPYAGVGYVSSKLRTPEPLYYVTGGKLTCNGSPVFTAGGSVVGIVARSLPFAYQMMSNTGPQEISLTGVHETPCFLPIEEFAHALKDIPRDGSIRRPPWIGALKIIGVSKQQSDLMKLDRPAVMMDRVIPDSPAAIAGVKTSDAIVAIDGKPLERLATPALVAANFVRQIRRMSSGQDITLTVLRAGQAVDMKLKLTTLPEGPDEANRYINGNLGFAVRDKVALDQYLTTSPVALIPGLFVVGASPRSPAAKAGLREGDVISSVGGQRVSTVAALRQIVTNSLSTAPNKAIIMRLHRDGQKPQNISIRPRPDPSSNMFNSPLGGRK